MRPPKNMTSVARNIHMPRFEATCCCSRSSNWGMRIALAFSSIVAVVDDLMGILRLFGRVCVRPDGHHGRLLEVVDRRRRVGLPLKSGRPPGVGARGGRLTQGK